MVIGSQFNNSGNSIYELWSQSDTTYWKLWVSVHQINHMWKKVALDLCQRICWRFLFIWERGWANWGNVQLLRKIKHAWIA